MHVFAVGGGVGFPAFCHCNKQWQGKFFWEKENRELWVICRVHFNSGPSFHALVIDTSLKLSYIHYSLRLQNPFRTHRSQIPTPASSQILKSLSNSLLHSFKTPKILSNGYAMSPWFVNHTSNTWPSVTHRVCMDTACCRGWQIWVIC